MDNFISIPFLQMIQGAWLFFGSIFSFVWAIQIFTSKPRTIFMGWIHVMTGIWLVSGFYFFSNLHLIYPYFFSLHLPFTYLIGPLFFLYYKKGILEVELNRFEFLHFIPAILVALVVAPYAFMDTTSQLSFIKNLQNGDASFYSRMIQISTVGPKISLIIYLSYILVSNVRILRNSADISFRSMSIFVLVIALIYIDIGIGFLGFMMGNFFLIKLSALILPFNLIIFFLLSNRFPEVVYGLQKEIKKARYEKSKIKSLDIDLIQSTLKRIMEEEKAFSDEDLNIAGLASELNISVHQLSQILNEKMEMTFTQYINHHRVSEAKKYLLEDQSRTIISIAYAVGFNSKSSFNRAFKHHTGITPVNYRKNYSTSLTQTKNKTHSKNIF
ncbi:AraC family transcriptional regulator [Leptospira sp. GIMC2001]|uniref:AraC family transcriptional regulator n=1 Tax=Leptospira sp. GIMC2001 TaxID=1513297 RepID=UPI00234948DC|nr:helix-turn-helix domain-containing protein [Leptospira sp. GIMC2001]WCL48517.1 helix-turn-helix domain-containing protein [Leptospira sp. GIMC2001]